jgi:hypothetical protein
MHKHKIVREFRCWSKLSVVVPSYGIDALFDKPSNEHTLRVRLRAGAKVTLTNDSLDAVRHPVAQDHAALSRSYWRAARCGKVYMKC